jgi:hypothetical protein
MYLYKSKIIQHPNIMEWIDLVMRKPKWGVKMGSIALLRDKII